MLNTAVCCLADQESFGQKEEQKVNIDVFSNKACSKNKAMVYQQQLLLVLFTLNMHMICDIK